MSFLDKLTERVGGFLDEVFLPEDVARSLDKASRAIQREDYKYALEILARTQREQPGFHRTQHLLGLCHFHREHFEQAITCFDRAIELREVAVSHFYAGLSAEQLGRHHEAQVHFQRALELSDGDDLHFDLLFGLGRVYLAQSRPDKAARELKKARKLMPDQPEATVALARALLGRARVAEARKLLESRAARDAGLPALVLRGQLEEREGRPSHALEAYQAALEEAPDDADALVGAARASLQAGKPHQANDYLVKALEVGDDDLKSEIHALLGRVSEATGDRETALGCYDAALAADAHRPEALLGAGRVLLDLGRAEEASQRFRRVLSAGGKDDDHHRRARLGLAEANLETGDLGGARRLLDEVIQAEDAHQGRALHLLGRVALESGDAAEAVVAFQEALHAHDGEPDPGIEEELHRALGQLTPDWHLPDTLDDSTDLRALLDQVRDFLRSDPRVDQFLPRVQQMHTALNSPLSIAIVGEFNAGKSTLLNALIGEEVVPMGVLPTTAHTCFIQYGPRKAARVVGKDGEVNEVTLEEAKRQMKTDADDIDHLEFLYPHPELRSVEFWDTPGFNALEDAHEETASEALEEAEAILWVLDANQALTQTEFELIESIPDGDERLLVLLNKVDRFGPPEARQASIDELVEYVEENAAGRIAGSFPMSAIEALEARTDPDEADPKTLDASGFEPFRDFLESRIIERSGRIKTLEISRQLHSLIEDLQSFRSGLVDGYAMLATQTAEMRSWLEQMADERPEQRARKQARTLEDRFDFVLTGIEREIREALQSRGTWLTRRVLSEEDKQFILDLLAERLADVLERSRQQVLGDVGELESMVAQRVGPIVQNLPLVDARALNRRVEGFFDETRVLKLLLEERVYGQLRAKAMGQIEVAGRQALEEIRSSDEEGGPAWKAALRRLLPDTRSHLRRELAGWYGEFFLAACRFSDRVQRDLQLLKLETEHRLDLADLAELAGLENC